MQVTIYYTHVLFRPTDWSITSALTIIFEFFLLHASRLSNDIGKTCIDDACFRSNNLIGYKFSSH